MQNRCSHFREGITRGRSLAVLCPPKLFPRSAGQQLRQLTTPLSTWPSSSNQEERRKLLSSSSSPLAHTATLLSRTCYLRCVVAWLLSSRLCSRCDSRSCTDRHSFHIDALHVPTDIAPGREARVGEWVSAGTMKMSYARVMEGVKRGVRCLKSPSGTIVFPPSARPGFEKLEM